MSNGTSTRLAQQIGALYSGGSAVGVSDRQLLERFASARDEAAFAALVARHGAMVLGICRRHLGDHQHAEDAFQAVFLVLARRAGSLREPELLGNWLYGVALRTARTARARLARRRRVEEEAAGPGSGAGSESSSSSGSGSSGRAADRSLLDGEQAEALHREIDRLPGPFRMPVVLCYFEGLTLDEAARRLSWPVGTLRSRLARAREKLRRGLVRRGFAPTAGVLGGALSDRPFPFSYPLSSSASSLLCDSTTRAAIAFAARRGAGDAVAVASAGAAAATAQEVLRTMLIHKLRAAALALLFLAFGAAGAGWLGRPLVMGDEPRMKERSSSKGPRADVKAPADVSPARLLVDGRVIDPQGRPVSQARVAVLADRRARAGDRDGRHRNILVGTAAVDANGRFTLDVDGLPGERLERLTLLASAPGRALTAAALKPGDVLHETTVTLEPERPVEARLVDIQGQPASGVVVRVARIAGDHPLMPYDGKGQPILWPAAATTGADGRFRILGLGAGAGAAATFEVEDGRYAHQSFTVPGGGESSGSPSGSVSTITLRPAQAVEVLVVHADDGTPAAGALVTVQAIRGRMPTNDVVRARTDDQGRARVVGWPATEYRVRIDPAEGEPYFHSWDDLDWPKAAVQLTHEFRLRRGTVVSGRVVEGLAGTPRPIAGAWMTYYQTARDNPRRLNLLSVETVSGADGSFRVVVPAGPGHLLVEGPSEEYLHVETSSTEMGIGVRPSFHLYPHAHAVLDIPPGEATHPLEIRLRRGVTITGRMIGPDGRAAAEGWVFGRGYAPYREGTFPFVAFNGPPPRVEVKDGRFEIPGCDPENPGTFHFLDAKDRLGATVELPARSAANGPITVKLQPTATARFAMKDAEGRPIAGRDAGWPADLRVVITPGPDFGALNNNFNAIPGDFTYQEDIDPANDRNLKSGPDGRVTMINLIPGARYRFHGREFVPKPGETIDLGDVPTPKPGG